MRVFLILPLLLFLSLPAAAQEESAAGIPPELQGLWVKPGCTNPEISLFYTRKFVLKVSGSDSSSLRHVTSAEPVAEAPGAWAVTTEDRPDRPYEIARTSDDRLLFFDESMLQAYGLGVGFPHAAEENRYARRHENCLSDPPSNTVPALKETNLALLRALDGADDACGYKTLSADDGCRRAAFDMIDANGDGGLDAAELAALWIVVADLARIGACGAPPTSFPDMPESGSGAFAADALAAADIDGGGSLSFNEIMSGWEALSAGRHGYLFTVYAQSFAPILWWVK
ncbi:MAG: hypothetical protein HY370_04775 [Proteobacteria bacterium]|nr:hypothetical protein [Pseudomonadota bacterium]